MKTALVISGGGCTGAYAVGAIDYLANTLKLNFDMVLGTSTGSLCASMAYVEDYRTLLGIYSDANQIFKAPDSVWDVVQQGYVFDSTKLSGLIQQQITAHIPALNSFKAKKQLIIPSACLETGMARYFYWGPPATLVAEPGSDIQALQNPMDLVNVMLASSLDPVLFKPTVIPNSKLYPNEPPELTYCDGGVRVFAPIWMAMLNGAEKVIAIVLSPKVRPEKDEDYSSILNTLLRTLELFPDQIGQRDVQIGQILSDAVNFANDFKNQLLRTYPELKADAVEALFQAHLKNYGSLNQVKQLAQKLVVIRPSGELTNDPNTFEPGLMNLMIQQGRADAQAQYH